MDFFELIEKRYSVRAYQSKPVEEEKLQKVLEAARLAPTAANRQPFRIIVMKTEGKEADLKQVYRQDWFSQAPLVICACAVPDEAWIRSDGKDYYDVDTTIAMDHLILAAANLGLGTCWIAAFDPAATRKVFGLPDDIEPVALTPLGYPADNPRPKHRKILADLVKYDKW
jgi:nitroreductase